MEKKRVFFTRSLRQRGDDRSEKERCALEKDGKGEEREEEDGK